MFHNKQRIHQHCRANSSRRGQPITRKPGITLCLHGLAGRGFRDKAGDLSRAAGSRSRRPRTTYQLFHNWKIIASGRTMAAYKESPRRPDCVFGPHKGSCPPVIAGIQIDTDASAIGRGRRELFICYHRRGHTVTMPYPTTNENCYGYLESMS